MFWGYPRYEEPLRASHGLCLSPRRTFETGEGLDTLHGSGRDPLCGSVCSMGEVVHFYIIDRNITF